MTHVDDWINSAGMRSAQIETDAERYAKFFFLLKRLPAVMQGAFKEHIEKYQLYCEFEGRSWRVTGASRMGDVWLTSDFNQDAGYEERVDLAQCSNWSPTPPKEEV